MCSDVHIPTMHDSKFRITTFMDAMKETNPDFIIELGDFAEVSDTDYFKIWNSFHWDYVEKINEVWYIHINSMAYNWLGDSYTKIRYSKEVDQNFKWIKYTAPYKDPLFTTVVISTKGWIKISGKKTEWVGPSPFELGYPERMKKYIRPAITQRTLKF